MIWVCFLIGGLFLGIAEESLALKIFPPAGTRRIVFFSMDGKPLEALEDQDADGRFERTLFYADGHLKKVLVDRNGDGRPEKILLFDSKERLKELLFDRNADGRPDKWQFYRAGRVVEVREDRDFDGQVDLRAEIGNSGKPQRIERDEDHDGCFEIEELLGRQREVFFKKFEGRNCSRAKVVNRVLYQGKNPRRRFLDQDLDGRFEVEEIFRPDGTRCLLLKKTTEEKEAFFYESGRLRFGFRDPDGDDCFEERFDYSAKVWQEIDPLPLKELESLCEKGKDL